MHAYHNPVDSPGNSTISHCEWCSFDKGLFNWVVIKHKNSKKLSSILLWNIPAYHKDSMITITNDIWTMLLVWMKVHEVICFINNVSLSAKEWVGEFYIKGTVVVSNMLLQHFWEAPYKPERLPVTGNFPVSSLFLEMNSSVPNWTCHSVIDYQHNYGDNKFQVEFELLK